MSSFGAFGGGPTFTNFGGSNNQQSGNPFGDYYSLVMNAGMNGNPPPGYTYNPATGMNQAQVGGSFSNPFGAVTFQRPTYTASGPSGMAQYQGGALADYAALYGANEQNYQNTMNAGNAFLASAQSGAEDIRQAGLQAQNDLYGFAQDVNQQGQDFYADISRRVDEAEQGFQDLGASQASSLAAGQARAAHSENQKINAAALYGDPNAIAMKAQNDHNAQIERYQIMSQQASAFNQGLAGLRMQGAGTLVGAGGVVQGLSSIASNLNQMGASIYNSAQAMAAQFETQGFQDYANFIAANPYNPVSFLPTLTSFFQFTQTPGADDFGGFASELLTA